MTVLQAFEEWQAASLRGQEGQVSINMGLNNSTMRMVAGMRSQLLVELQVQPLAVDSSLLKLSLRGVQASSIQNSASNEG